MILGRVVQGLDQNKAVEGETDILIANKILSIYTKARGFVTIGYS